MRKGTCPRCGRSRWLVDGRMPPHAHPLTLTPCVDPNGESADE